MSDMAHFKYLIIGGGMAADAAVKGIRQTDGDGSIGIISGEDHAPYSRPPLSKALWKGEPLDSIWRNTPERNLTLFRSTRATGLDPRAKRVKDARGETYTYEKLLLATGGKLRRLSGAPDGVIYFRTLDDYLVLRGIISPNAQFVVIGGGFIGSEIAAALSMNGRSVTMMFPESGIGARVYPPALSKFLTTYYAEKGIRMLSGAMVSSIRKEGETYHVSTGGQETIRADAVIAGLGIAPDTELAETAGVAVENGIVVDERLETSAPDVFAAGDVAVFFSPALAKRIRVEHEDNALSMGEFAGRSMAGESVAYRHIPFFYSDLFDLGYEAVGELDSRLAIVEDWREPFRKGVVYYHDQGRVRGVLLWNTWGQVDAARALISEAGPIDPRTLPGRIHD
jgi:3-phenylpropionate/trans-cinnamate dioxygenase ferredoxin reductase subunit